MKTKWTIEETEALESLRDQRKILERLLEEAVKGAQQDLLNIPLEGDGSAVLNAKARLEGAESMARRINKFLLK